MFHGLLLRRYLNHDLTCVFKPIYLICQQARTWDIQCQICYMTFSDQSAISAHYDTAHAQSSSSRPEHPDARYECDVCYRKFTQKGSLKVHLSTVHGVGDVKTFQCDVCSKIFTHKSSLKLHLSTVHCVGDVKTFQCDVCSRVFKEKSKLVRHMNSVHKTS